MTPWAGTRALELGQYDHTVNRNRQLLRMHVQNTECYAKGKLLLDCTLSLGWVTNDIITLLHRTLSPIKSTVI